MLHSIANNHWNNHMASMQCSIIMLLFLGVQGPIIIFFCKSASKILGKLSISPLFFGLLGEMLWWLMGNRFEYSGVDVVKSYIFSSEYHPLINGISLLILMIAPHLTLFIHMNLNGVIESKTDSKMYISVGSA
jgi:hypothetical protein